MPMLRNAFVYTGVFKLAARLHVSSVCMVSCGFQNSSLIRSGDHWTWRTNTWGDMSHMCHFTFYDGQISLIDDHDGEIWSSNTKGQGYTEVTLSGNGKLMMVKPDGIGTEIPSQ